MTMTHEQKLAAVWRNTPRDYRSIVSGQKCVLVLRDGEGTCLVSLNSLTDEEIQRKLPKELRS